MSQAKSIIRSYLCHDKQSYEKYNTTVSRDECTTHVTPASVLTYLKLYPYHLQYLQATR